MFILYFHLLEECERERGIFHPLVDSPDVLNSKDWAKSKPAARSSIGEAEAQVLEPSSPAVPPPPPASQDALAESWTRQSSWNLNQHPYWEVGAHFNAHSSK